MNDVFKYDNGISYEDNFSRWFAMNSKEKQNHKEKPYTNSEARKLVDREVDGVYRVRDSTTPPNLQL